MLIWCLIEVYKRKFTRYFVLFSLKKKRKSRNSNNMNKNILLSLVFVIITIRTMMVSGLDTCIPDANVAVYEDLKCSPIRDRKYRCISSYNCEFIFKPDRTKCYYQGEEYSVGEKMISTESESCYPVCSCENITGQVQFLCSKIQCEEDYTSKNNCIYSYSNDACCAIKEYCDKEKDRALQELSHCIHNKVPVLEGHYMMENCRRCVCEAGFDNSTFDPTECKRVPCDLEKTNGLHIQNFCAPVYLHSNDCCPIFWHCPVGSEKILTDFDVKMYTHEHCKFGNLLLKTSQKLIDFGNLPYSKCINCSCLIPPLLSCDVNERCSYDTETGILEDKSQQNFRRQIPNDMASGDYYNYHIESPTVQIVVD